MPIGAECCCLYQWSRCVFFGIFLRVSGAKKWRGRGYTSPLHSEGMRVVRGALRGGRVKVRGRGVTWSVTRRVCRNCGRSYSGEIEGKNIHVKNSRCPQCFGVCKILDTNFIYPVLVPPRKIRFFELIIIKIQHFLCTCEKRYSKKSDDMHNHF